MELAYQYAYPNRTRAERAADIVVHMVAIAAMCAIMVQSNTWAEATRALALALMFTISGFYHHTPSEAWREPLRRLDHAAIFICIAATTTPTAAPLPATFLWTLCLIAAFYKFRIGKWEEWVSQSIYLALGIVAGALIVTTTAPAALIISGAFFACGMIAFNLTQMPYHMAIWHVCVLGGVLSLVG